MNEFERECELESSYELSSDNGATKENPDIYTVRLYCPRCGYITKEYKYIKTSDYVSGSSMAFVAAKSLKESHIELHKLADIGKSVENFMGLIKEIK